MKVRFSVSIIFVFVVYSYKQTLRRQKMNSSEKFVKESRMYQREQLDSFKELEGDCKIVETKYLQFSCIKTALLIIPVAISIVGLFILKYYPTFRVKVFYNESDENDATHVFIEGEDKSQKIEKILSSAGEQHRSFMYRKLKYKIMSGTIVPVGLNLKRYYNSYVDEKYAENGLITERYEIQKHRYGKNEHGVDPPNYFQYAFKILTQPFFLIQYLAAVIYFAQKLESLAILLLAASVLTVTLNYILLYYSYQKIKEVAEKEIEVTVIRNGKQQTIIHTDIVPGDIYLLTNSQQIPCDGLLLKGEAYVNEASLTGESVPIGKFPCDGVQELKQSSRWIYEGSQVLSTKEESLVLAVHTGYRSKRGRIIRKILTKKQLEPEFFKSIIFFLLETFVFATIAYLATLGHLLAAEIETVMVVLLFLLFITFCFPPALPIYFNLSYSFCLARLKFKGINGTEPHKTIEGTNLRIMCFDKTGTLTEETVTLKKVYRFSPQGNANDTYQEVGQSFDKPENQLVQALFTTCHTVREFDGQLQGDEIDLKMFLHSHSTFEQCSESNVKCMYRDGRSDQKYEVLRINQYESKFQSMSVLARVCQEDRYFIFCKGAPEKIYSFSKIKYGNAFVSLLEQLSYKGLRTIAFGYREIKHSELQHFLHVDRDEFLRANNFLGMVAFENKLKHDTVDTIGKLREAHIQSKMITGDSIYIAIETAMRSRIVDEDEEIIVIEGANQSSSVNLEEAPSEYIAKVVFKKDNKFEIQECVLTQKQYLNSNKSIAVDNSFIESASGAQSLSPMIKVFARITPENKAKIVRTYKEQFTAAKEQIEGCWSKLIAPPTQKVGMVGDGANDLIALKEADIGMGISNSDASYAATFAINGLLDIDEVLRESKATERSILEIVRFYAITNFLSIALILPLFGEGSFFGDFQLTFLNLTKLIVLNLAFPLSRPQPEPSKFKPQSNFMGLENHLVFWGNVLIYTLGYTVAYLYGREFSEEFIPNPQPQVTFDDGYFSQTFSVTILFLCFNMQPPTLALFLYKSKPWREIIFKNIILSLIIFLNIGWGIAAFFLTDELKDFLELVPLSEKVELTVFIIMLITVALIFAWNLFVDCLKLHERDFRQQQQLNDYGNGRMILLESEDKSSDKNIRQLEKP